MENIKSQHLTPVELWMTVALVLFLLLLAALGTFVPVDAASGFGIPLADPLDAFYLRIKGDRDLGSALAVGALLWLGDRRALGAVILAMTIEPILDASLIIADPRGHLVQALTVHGSAVVYCMLLAWRLLRRRDGASTPLARSTGGTLATEPGQTVRYKAHQARDHAGQS